MLKKSNSLISINMPEDVYAAYKKDFQNGIVTVGNVCSANCFFCSQKWNPPGVIKDLKRFLAIEEIKHFTNVYLDKAKIIASAFHTNSGEFFLHPDAIEILDFLAAQKKLSSKTPIFTNGMDLTKEYIKIIKKLNLYLNLSLHTINISTREKIMGNNYLKNKNAIDSLDMLDKYGVDYCVWIVPLRSTLGNGDLENTVKYLKKCKAQSVFIHRPGYTKYTPAHIAKELTIPDNELFYFNSLMRQRYKVNINFDKPSVLLTFKIIFNKLCELFKSVKYLNNKSKLFLCSEAVKDILPLVLRKLEIKNYKIKVSKSKVFGGDVDCAGLLLVEDYICAIKDFLRHKQNQKPEIIILPGISFDINKEDLSMESVKKIEDRFKIELILV